ncbi:MAG TPA: hypothetical protein VFD04_10620 [Actinomycetes bacterium]|jgi:hypothetical protein|nr:hypothetical protein [Actinomycetes bacterium]
MAEDRWLIWQAEAAGTHTGPTTLQVLLTFAVFAVLAVVLALGSAVAGSPAGSAGVRDVPEPCATLHRLEHRGVRSGPAYRAAWWGCPQVRAQRTGR